MQRKKKPTKRKQPKRQLENKFKLIDHLLVLIEWMPKEPFTVSEAAKATNLAYSSMYNWMHALENRGWVEGKLDASVYPARYRWRALKSVVTARK